VIELVGGGTRIPAVANVVKEIVGINPSRTLNAEEAVAKGCALRCAILSPSFKVRDYEIVEFNLYEVKAKINQKDKEEIIQELFKKNCIVPASKEKKLKEKKPFVVEVGYDENAGIPTGEEPVIGKWRFEKMPVIGMKLDPIIKERSEPGDIHVKFALDQDSILRLEDAYFEETIVYYEKITKKKENNNNNNNNNENKDNKDNNNNKMETNEEEEKKKKEEEEKEAVVEEEVEKKKNCAS